MTAKNFTFLSCYENTIDAFIPEQWANESIALLMENMVAATMVHRDFEPLFAKYGDTVNTRQPADFEAIRKTNADDVTVQDASATNVPVTLDQHIHVSFLIRDGQETMAFKSLVDEFLRPAAIAMARKIDRVVLGQYSQFVHNQAGTLGGLTNSNAVDYITATGQVLDDNLCPTDGRNIVLTSASKTKCLQNTNFINAEKAGDQGTALRKASLGELFGMQTWMSQNLRSVPADTTLDVGAINNGAGYPVGATSLTVDGFGSGEIDPGQWITIGGRPYHVTATNNATATTLTLEYGLKAAVLDDAVISVYDVGAVNNGAGYAAGYSKTITVDGGAAINLGQIVTFGTSTVRYTVIKTDGSTTIELDRPLVAALVDDDTVNMGPTGDFNFAFHRNAMTLAIRPLALPRAGAGAISGLANFDGLTMRTVITYDGNKQGHLVTLDFLAGIKVLDTHLGAVMLG